MIRLTLTTCCPLALLLLCGPSHLRAQGNTPITVKDGGSLLLIVDGLDTAHKWKVLANELRHMDEGGVLSGVSITEGGADRCNGDAKCGIDPNKPWSIVVIYDLRRITISSLSGKKGVHIRFSPKILFSSWQKTGEADHRMFGHGDGRNISSIQVNGSDSRCAGKGGCAVSVTYATP